MAVPKKRTSRASQGQRRSHHAIKPTQLLLASNGERLSRRLLKAASLGLIKGRTK